MSRAGIQNKETLSWPEGFRKCTKCEQVKSLLEFHKHKDCTYGVNTVCKTCRKPLSTKQWQKTSAEYKIWIRVKSRAKLKNLEFNLEISDIIIPQVCPVFNVPFDKESFDYTPSVDRIDPKKGYVKDNIKIISNKANRIKNNADIKEIKLVLKYLEGCMVK